MDRPKLEVADIFRRYGEAYRQRHDGSLSTAQRRVMTAIEVCRTAALGGHLERCDCCNHERPFRCASQLGTEPVFPSSSALCPSRRRDFTGWRPVDLLPPQLFLTGKGALSALPPIVLAVSAGGLRRRQVAVLLFASGTPRSRGFHPS